MSSRWKKVWADFWGNKSRTALTILTILVGTFGVGFISNLQLYMVESMDGDYLSASPSEARIYAYPMDDDSVKIARDVPGVDAVEGRSITNVQVLRPDGENIAIQFTAVKNPNDLMIDTLQPVKNESSMPPLRDREVLIDVSATSLGYRLGDLLTVELSNGRRRELRVAGYLHDATGVPYSQANMITAFVTPNTIEWLGGSLDYNVLLISVAEQPNDYEHVTQVAQKVRERLERGGLTVGYIFVMQPPGHHYAYQISQGIFLVMSALGWLTVLLSGFLIVNTITALMSQQTRQIGIMKATGGTTLQIFGMYLTLILGFGLIALLIAIPLANRAAQTIGDGMAAYLGFYTRPYQGYTATLIQQIIVALVVPLLTALVPVYNTVRVTVREAITDYGIGSGHIPQKKTVGRGSLLVPRPIRLSLRNAVRRKARLSLTLISLVLGGAIFVSVINLWGSFYQVIEELKGYYLTDVDISFDRLYRFDKVAAMTKGVPEVDSVEGWMQRAGSLIRGEDEPETQVLLVAPPATSRLVKPILISGRWLKPGDENAITISNYLLDRFPELRVGDELTIKIDGHETQWRIVGVFSTTATGGSPVLYVTYEYFSQLINQPEQVYSLRVITTSHDLETQQRVGERLKEIFTARGISIGAIGLGADEVQRIASLFDIFIYFFLAMAALIAVIGGVGLASTMSINVLERTREIGVMRAIGASNGNIQSIVIVEGMVIGLISWVISVLLSIPFTGVMATLVGQLLFRKPMTIVYGLNGILSWLIGTLVIGMISSVIPARGASRLTVKDTLAYE
jgi:putative ABC transport system permease protein